MRHIIFACMILYYPLFTYAHPGGLDKNSGHTDSRTGVYHYHIDGKAFYIDEQSGERIIYDIADYEPDGPDLEFLEPDYFYFWFGMVVVLVMLMMCVIYHLWLSASRLRV